MSLVGPRPERPEFVAELTKQIPFYGQRHVVQPGLTGWAQVRYTYGASVEDALEKLQYDLFYIKHMSLALRPVHPARDRQDGGAAAGRRDDCSAADRQRDDHRRRGLLPGVSAFDASCRATPWDRAREPRRRQHRAAARAVRSAADVARHVLRARLGRRALPGAGPRDRRGAATRSRRTATPIGWSTTRRRTQFRDDVRRAKATARGLGRRARCAAIARRATRSSRRESLWALDVLIEEGYTYDASIFPIRHDRYGIPVAPRASVRIERRGGVARRSAGVDRDGSAR